jgi:hypothetical protein
MSQVVKLKRTAVEGKVPTTSNIELGELAINTYDGRIFFEKDNGTATIQQVVTTNSQTTGSINILGNVTASYFVGDGSQLTNLPNSDVSQVATVTSSFDNQSSIVVTHNFGSKNVFISVYDNSDSQIIPQSVVLTNSNTVTVGLSGNHSGYVVVGKGGHLVSGTFVQEVSEVATVTASFDNQSSINVSHNFNSRNVIVSVYDSNYSQLIPETLTLTDENSVDIVLSGNHSGHVVVAKGGHFVSGSIITSADFTELTNVPSGLISGSSQLTSSYDSRYVLSGSITQTTWDNIASKPGEIVSSSSQLTSSYDIRYALSGSGASTFNRTIETYTATEGQTIFSTTATAEVGNVDVYINGFKLLTSDYSVTNSHTITLITGSSEGEHVEINLYNAFSGTYLTTEDLNLFTSSIQTRVDGLSSQTASLATTGSNTFVGTQTLSGSIIPATDNTYDLGSPTYQWKDIYVSSGSLYIDGTKVLGSTGNELQITTDVGQSIKILEAGSDSIILQSADGDIQLKSSGGGNLLFDPTTGLIDVRGTFQIQDGYKVTSSGGNAIQFGNDLGITGSISTTGNINGINLSTFSSSLSNQITSIQNSTSSTEERWTMFFTYTSSNDTTNTTQNNRLTSLETKSGSVDSSISNINSFTSSNGNTALNDYTSSLKTALSVSGQNVTINGNFTVSGTQTIVDSTTVQIGDNIIELNGSGAANGGIQVKDVTIPNTATGSLIWDSTNDYWKAGVKDSEVKILLANGDNVVSGSSQVVGILSSLNTYTGSNDTTNTTQNSRLTALESTTGSYETQGRGIVSGSSQVSYTGLSNIPSGIVSGSSQITLSSTTGYGSVINQAVLTTSSPTFAGGTITGNLIIGNQTNQYIRYRTASAWDYYLSAVNDDFSLYDSQGTIFLKAFYNGGGSGKYITFLNALTVNNNTNITIAGNFLPASNNSQDLGSAAVAWRNIYTNDLHLSNEGKPEGNDVDGTTGNWTIQEGAEHLYIINNKTGKKFKFSLEEIQ